MPHAFDPSMTSRVLRIGLALALAASLSPDAQAEPKKLRSEGCIAIGTHSVAVSSIRPWDCYYIATGPSYYAASTTNPFVISIWNEKLQRYEDVVRRAAPGPFTAGMVRTKPGDRVAVSISCWDYTSNTWCKDAIGGRYGTIGIHSQL